MVTMKETFKARVTWKPEQRPLTLLLLLTRGQYFSSCGTYRGSFRCLELLFQSPIGPFPKPRTNHAVLPRCGSSAFPFRFELPFESGVDLLQGQSLFVFLLVASCTSCVIFCRLSSHRCRRHCRLWLFVLATDNEDRDRKNMNTAHSREREHNLFMPSRLSAAARCHSMCLVCFQLLL